MSENQKILIFLASIAAAVLLIWNRSGIYCKDYYAVVNRAKNRSYEAIINENGSIKKTEIVEDIEYVYYEDGRTFVFRVFPSGSKSLCRIDITSEQNRFGKKKIGVGTKRKQLMSIYKFRKKRYYVYENYVEIVENNTSLGFYFNDKNVVYKMFVGEPDQYE